MVTDRHESEDVTLVPSRVMKVRMSTLGADSGEPGLGGILTLQVQQGYKQLSPARQHVRTPPLRRLPAEPTDVFISVLSVLSVEAA